MIRSARVLERVDTGLTMPQYRLLSLLDAGDERSTALAQRLAVSKPAISTAVEILTGLGHVARRADGEDRRVTWLQITPSGTAALERADLALAERLSLILDRMEQAEEFLARADEFAAAMDDDLFERRQQRQQMEAQPE